MNVPVEVNALLSIIQNALNDSLNAVYLHGSGASSGLCPCSDIDLLAVIECPITLKQKQQLTHNLLRTSGLYPYDVRGRRPIELIVFQQIKLERLPYPASCEYIYGEWLRTEYEENLIPSVPIDDPEFTLILAQAHQESIPLFKKKRNQHLPLISNESIRQAIRDALPNLLKHTQGDERNVLLTLARMYRTVVTEEFVSKNEAADWVNSYLPLKQANLLTQAKESYLSGREIDWSLFKTELSHTIDFLTNSILKNLEGN